MSAHGLTRLVSALLLSLASAGPLGAVPRSPAPVPPEIATKVRLDTFLVGASQPVALVSAPGDPARRLFVVEKTGTVRAVRNGRLGAVLLDYTKQVSRGSEQGLLGLAFHPEFAGNGKLYINYTDLGGDTRVVELRLSSPLADAVERSHRAELLFVDQPYANHNGGHLVFGPDGKLYVGLGDGGGAGDPHKHGQNPSSLLGKMLRLDVDHPGPPEILQLGLRNPWRYSFDRARGDLYLGDVGQNKYEEIDVVGKDSLSGRNFGWNVLEGLHCFNGFSCKAERYTAPAIEYSHKDGCSVTGGHVYRGRAIPELDGMYFYSDFCTGLLRSFRWQDGKVRDHWDWKKALDPQGKLKQVSSFAEDSDGELYVLSLEGVIFKLGPAQ